LRGAVDASSSSNAVCDFVWEDDLNLLQSFYAKVLNGSKLSPIAASITVKDVKSYRVKRSVMQLLGGNIYSGGRSGRSGSRNGNYGRKKNHHKNNLTNSSGGLKSDSGSVISEAIKKTRAAAIKRAREVAKRNKLRRTSATDGESSAPPTDTETTRLSERGDVTDDDDAERIQRKREKLKKQRQKKKMRRREKDRKGGGNGASSSLMNAGGDASGEATAGNDTDGPSVSSRSSTPTREKSKNKKRGSKL
jgi:hypothetical protein